MARVAPIEPEDCERECLVEVIKKSADWRERDRAETVLLLADGHSVQAMAEQQGLCREAVRGRWRKWLKSGLASLGGGQSAVVAGIADAAGARLPGDHRPDDVAHGIEVAGLCVEAHLLQLKKTRPGAVRASPGRDRRPDPTSGGGRDRTGLRGRGGIRAAAM